MWKGGAATGAEVVVVGGECTHDAPMMMQRRSILELNLCVVEPATISPPPALGGGGEPFQQQKLAQGAGHRHRHAVPVRRRLRVRGHLRGQLWHRGLQLQTAGPGAAGRLRLRPGLRRVQRESGR